MEMKEWIMNIIGEKSKLVRICILLIKMKRRGLMWGIEMGCYF